VKADTLFRNAVEQLGSVDVLPFLFYVTTHSFLVPSWGSGSDCCEETRRLRICAVTEMDMTPYG